MFGLLTLAAQQKPRARLLMAHAHASNGQAIAAWSHANEARRGLSALSANDRDLLDLIEIGTDHTLGRATVAELAAREDLVRQRAKPELRIQLEVSALRQAITLSGDPERFGEFAEKARALITSTAAALDATHPATLSARVLESQVAGNSLAYRYARLLMTCHYGDSPIGLQMRNGVVMSEAVSQMNAELAGWLRTNGEAQQAASEWPLLCLELEIAELLIHLVLLRYTRLMGLTRGVDTEIDLGRPPGSDLLARIIGLRERAARLRVDDVEVRARMLLVELLDLSDNTEAERAEAEALAEYCRACGYQSIEAEARLHQQGKSRFREGRREMMSAQRKSAKEEITSATPEERAAMAENMRAFLNLPASRLPNIIDGVDCMAELEVLRTEWCRHFEMLEDLSHTHDGATLYARPPRRRCVCQPRQLTTMFPAREWRALIVEFRRTHCDSCPQRSPAATPSPS